MVTDSFVHLHNHSDYSLLDGAMKCKALAQRAAEYGMPALALTDHGNLFGAVEFYQKCRKVDVKPILGMEAYVTRDHRDRDSEFAKRNNHLILLVSEAAGWRNLMRLSSLSFLDGFYYKPRVDKELLAAHSEGLIALSACMSGEPNSLLARDDLPGAIRVAGEYAEIFGKQNYYLEIQDHGIPQETRIRQLMPQVARATGLDIVATNDCHFLDREHHQAHDILLSVQTNRQYDDPGRWKSQTDQVYFKSPREMCELFQDWPDAVSNTLRIAERCNFELELGKLLLPEFPLPEGFASAESYVEHLARRGLAERFPAVTAELEERLNYELGVIREMGYAGYFLIVWDFIDAARKRDIPVGPGRGSAAGSLVCYCMRITDIDPIANGLIFERFLNPDRISMPDIDIDFCFEKRPEIIQYVADKYGQDNVSQIITFGTMAARGVLKDVSRVLGFSFQEADRISKLVPEEIGITLDRALKEAPGLAAVRKESPKHDMLIRNALILEGLCRNPGIHAAGVLITPTALINHAPLHKSAKNDITVQFDMKMSEKLGLLKMDFLGLRTLTVIDKALRLIAETNGVTMRPEDIPLDDPVTFELLQAGRTVGIFQLESGGMQELVSKLKPTCFADIVAVNALFRPGPLRKGMDEVYVECKHGRRQVVYQHACLEPILRETYGVILYQEQVMQIAGTMGNFTMAEADTLRKAMGKKNMEMMTEMRSKFMLGAAENSYPARKAENTFDEMATFAEYGFNKSHSASYAVLSLRTAWLKAHHPAEFMAATMSTEMRKSDRITVLIDEVKNLGLQLAPPDINDPRSEFAVRDQTIVFGMGAVKNVGVKAIEEIQNARQAAADDFEDLFDLCQRIDMQKVNRKVLESLIHAGALDCLPGHRRQLIDNLERALAFGNRAARDRQQGQASLFSGASSEAIKPALSPAEPYDPLTELSLERQAVGFFLSGHPFHEYREFITALPVAGTADAKRLGEGTWVELVGVITSYQETRDKHKRLYARTHFEDRLGMIEVIVYARLYEEAAELVQGDSILVVGGRIRVRSDGKRDVVAERLINVDSAMTAWTQQVLLDLELKTGAGDTVSALRDFLSCTAPTTEETGCRVPLLVRTQREGQSWLLRSRDQRFVLNLDNLRRLRSIAGVTAVRLQCGLPAPVPRRRRPNHGAAKRAVP
ncbi:MAG: DNA polymerase III subunit alpha [bacterium]